MTKEKSLNTGEGLTKPNLSIKDIDIFGVVIVQFTKEMLLHSNASRINETTFELSVYTENE